MRQALATVTTALFFFTFASGEVIRIDERVEVNSEQISLGDIAQILPENSNLAQIPIGYAPYPGYYRWISKPDIESCLHKWGFDQKVEIKMKERVLVTRESQLVDSATIESEVSRFLASSFPDYRITIRELQVPSDLFLPSGPLEVSVDSPASLNRLDGVSLKLNFTSRGERLKSQWVRVSAVAEGTVVVLRQDVPYGKSLSRSDLTAEIRSFNRLESYITNENDVIGCIAKRALREGEILTRRDLKEAVLVNRGDVVTLLARGPAFVVRALGRSRDSGSRGDAVVIENLDSKQLVHATVVGNKTVEVVVAGGAR